MFMKINVNKTVNQDQISSKSIILVAHCFMLVVLILFWLLSDPFSLETQSLIYLFSCLLCFQAIWSFWSWYMLTKSLFNPYLLFFLSAFLFNAGQALLQVFHLNKAGILGQLDFTYFTDETIINALFLVMLSLASWHLGALISVSPIQSIYVKSKIQEKILSLSSKNCYDLGYFLMCVSLFPSIYVLKNNLGTVISDGYAGLYQVEDATGFAAIPNILSTFIVPSSFFLLVGSKYKNQGKILSVTIIVIYSIMQFIIGQRNQGIMPLISFAWLWNNFVRPLPKILLLGSGCLMMFVFIPLIATTRDAQSQQQFSIDFLVESFSSIDNPVVAAISEMGSSLLTVTATLELVPATKNFQLGAEYLYALLTLVPNYFGKVHPTIARGIPDQWLVEQINPYFAMNGGTYGFSFIAEAYLNFGWIGTPIALALMGFMFANFISWASRYTEPGKMALLASFISFFLFFPRSESALLVRPLFWYSLIPYWVVCFLNKNSLKNNKIS